MTTEQIIQGLKEDVYTLSTGDVVLQWPRRITAEEAEGLNDWLEIMKRKLSQSVSAIESDPRPYCS